MDSAQAYFAMPAFPRGPWPRQDTVVLAALPSSVSQARRHTREMLWEWKLDFLADDAEVIVSELASNAIRATQGAGALSRTDYADTCGGAGEDDGASEANGASESNGVSRADQASGPGAPTGEANGAGRARRASGPGAPIALRLLGDPSRLLILVWDPAPWPPAAPEAAPDADDENGRGLLLVTALAARWHWYHPPRRPRRQGHLGAP